MSKKPFCQKKRSTCAFTSGARHFQTRDMSTHEGEEQMRTASDRRTWAWRGENDVLLDWPFDISDKECLELWLREIGKIPRDVREGQRRNGNDDIDHLEELCKITLEIHEKRAPKKMVVINESKVTESSGVGFGAVKELVDTICERPQTNVEKGDMKIPPMVFVPNGLPRPHTNE